MNYKRTKHDKRFYIFAFILNLVCIGIIWSSYYFDYINMINNGYINKNAITFTMEQKEKPLKRSNSKFILLQVSDENPRLKYVWFNGNVKLPPIKYEFKTDIHHTNEKIAIIGRNVNINNVPPDYKVVGYFDTPNSYKLNSEIWLIPDSFQFDFTIGNLFIFHTPNSNKLEIIHKIINQNPINMITQENAGTYLLHSNKYLMISINIGLLFTIAIFMLIGMIWLSKEKYFIRIMYLHGYSRNEIFLKSLTYKLLPYVFITIPLLLIALVVQYAIFPLWSHYWINDSIYLFSGLVLYLIVSCFAVVEWNTLEKGGR
jgi:hypothetical protein